MSQEITRSDGNKFPQGVSGNKKGRPKGSKNKITLLKLMGEEAFREGNLDRMLNICEQVLEEAEDGDFRCRKLVWDAMITNGVSDASKGSVKPVINITTSAAQVSQKAEIVEEDAEDAVIIENEEKQDDEK